MANLEFTEIKRNIVIRDFEKNLSSIPTGTFLLFFYECENNPEGTKFIIEVYPNGISHANQGYVSVKISTTQVHKSTLQCLLTVVDDEDRHILPQSAGCEDSYLRMNCLFERFVKHSTLMERKEDVLSGDILTLHCEINHWNDAYLLGADFFKFDDDVYFDHSINFKLIGSGPYAIGIPAGKFRGMVEDLIQKSDENSVHIDDLDKDSLVEFLELLCLSCLFNPEEEDDDEEEKDEDGEKDDDEREENEDDVKNEVDGGKENEDDEKNDESEENDDDEEKEDDDDEKEKKDEDGEKEDEGKDEDEEKEDDDDEKEKKDEYGEKEDEGKDEDEEKEDDDDEKEKKDEDGEKEDEGKDENEENDDEGREDYEDEENEDDKENKEDDDEDTKTDYNDIFDSYVSASNDYAIKIKTMAKHAPGLLALAYMNRDQPLRYTVNRCICNNVLEIIEQLRRLYIYSVPASMQASFTLPAEFLTFKSRISLVKLHDLFDILKLYIAAHKYEVDGLKKYCEAYIIHHRTSVESDICYLMLFGDFHHWKRENKDDVTEFPEGATAACSQPGSDEQMLASSDESDDVPENDELDQMLISIIENARKKDLAGRMDFYN